jgi:hypothetical protein
MAEKARVPEAAAEAFIRASLDHFVNQIYRALKGFRDGDPIAARLEAAEATGPLLDALFALNGRRLKPYYKYLAWELAVHPLALCPWDAGALPAMLAALTTDPSGQTYRELLTGVVELFRTQGFGDVFDAWGDAMDWMLGARAAQSRRSGQP